MSWDILMQSRITEFPYQQPAIQQEVYAQEMKGVWLLQDGKL
jgi:hypothetical protein